MKGTNIIAAQFPLSIENFTNCLPCSKSIKVIRAFVRNCEERIELSCLKKKKKKKKKNKKKKKVIMFRKSPS